MRRPPVELDERAARRSLRDQIARLEREAAAMLAAADPRRPIDLSVRAVGGPRLPTLAGLERTRDALVQRLAHARAEIAERGAREADARLLLERMVRDPGGHRLVRLQRADLGLPGCGAYHVRPRLGLIGMLMGWWQVKLSGGCP